MKPEKLLWSTSTPVFIRKGTLYNYLSTLDISNRINSTFCSQNVGYIF